MAAFILNSDHQFITPRTNADLLVFDFEHMGDMNTTLQTNLVGALLAKQPAVRVGPSSDQYKTLQVFDVAIDGEQLGGLSRELSGIEDGNNVYVYVNRLGLCIITRIDHPSMKTVRINDYFGWSKYGVRVPREMIRKSAVSWNKLDMFNGETMMDVPGIVKAAEEAEELRRSLEEKNVELTACKKEVEENNVELTACKEEVEEKNVELTTCKKEMEENNVELTACKKEVEEKNVELTACKEEVEEKNVELTTCKKEMEEKNVELTACKKEVEEKNVELTACKKEAEEEKVELTTCKKELEEKNEELIACKKELELSKRMESDLSKLVEEKNKKVETLENDQLVASKAALNKRRFFCF